MLTTEISGFGILTLQHLVLDYNGTLALDGRILPGVVDRIIALAQSLQVHVLTADTFGTCAGAVAGLPIVLAVLESRPEDRAKQEYIEKLGPARCACIGNGANDAQMLQSAALGIAVLGQEGSAAKATAAADIIAPGICDALDLLLHPMRLRATLRT